MLQQPDPWIVDLKLGKMPLHGTMAPLFNIDKSGSYVLFVRRARILARPAACRSVTSTRYLLGW